VKTTFYKFLQFGVIFALLAAGIGALSVWADTPIVDFSADVTSGGAPLEVQFTDESGGVPTGWAWYFGDESFADDWSEVKEPNDEGWSARYAHTSVVLPDGSVLVMGGGQATSPFYLNDVWRSTDGGANWSKLTASAGWEARRAHTSVVLQDGDVLVMGGADDSTNFSDVWRSNDGGATWTELTEHAGWTPRMGHASVVMPDGKILVMGGDDGSDYLNDIWRSDDGGETWSQVIVTSPDFWSVRAAFTSVALANGDVLVMGGFDGSDCLNDIWRSADGGETWTELTEHAGWTPRMMHTSVVLPDGNVLVMGGLEMFGDDASPKNDVWRSTDGGTTWIELTEDVGFTLGMWTPRMGHASVVMPDGGVLVMGGGIINANQNDVWRLATAGSQEEDPSHTYAENGTYSVVLQAFNADGVSRISKQDYIRVLFRVTFDPNGGEGTMDPQTSDTPTSLTLNTFTRVGYTFTGWNTAANGSGTAYGDGAEYDFDENITLYAQWEALPDHTVTFDPNGGSGTMTPQAANIPTSLTLKRVSE
jgi:uncharacterized repeat protein (TIGR02543 family)